MKLNGLFFKRIVLSLVALVGVTAGVRAEGETAYALWCSSNSTLYFTNRTEALSAGSSFAPADGGAALTVTTVWSANQVTDQGTGDPAWNTAIRTALQRVVIEPSFAEVKPKSLRAWFYRCDKLATIEGLQYLNTEEATSMCYMFNNCAKLTSLDLTTFSTGKVTDMSYMFEGCKALQTLNVSNWNTAEVTDMCYMFSECAKLETFNLSSFRTPKVDNMEFMFRGCSSLSEVNVSGFTMEAITNMRYMFDGCGKLTELQLSSFNIETRSPWMSYMFRNCALLESVFVSDRWTATYSSTGMFEGCTAIEGEDGTTYDATAITNKRAHYGAGGYLRKGTQKPSFLPTNYAVYCDDTKTLYFTNSRQFLVKGSVFVPDGETYGYVVTELKSSTDGNVTDNPQWTSTVKNKVLAAVFESSYSSLQPTSLRRCFEGCKYLASVDGLDNLNTENVTDMQYMFAQCAALSMLDLSGFSTSQVTDMQSMFYGCSILSGITIGSGWTTANVNSSSSMFYNCSSLPNFDSSVIDKTNAHGGASGYMTRLPVTLTTVKDREGNYWASYYDANSGNSVDEYTTVYAVRKSADGLMAVLTTVDDGVIPAGSAVLLKSSKPQITLTVADASTPIDNNDLQGTATAIDTPANAYTLQSGGMNVGFYRYSEATLPAGSAYLILNSGSPDYVPANLRVMRKATFMADDVVVAEKDIFIGEVIDAPEVPAKEGYTGSWDNLPVAMPDKDITVTARYRVNKYSAYFKADGVLISILIQDYGTALTAPEAPAKEGHTFISWGDLPATMPAADTEYTAQYKVNQYKLTYLIDGRVYKTYTIDYGSAIEPEDTAEDDDYYYGWEEEPETMPAHDVEVNAVVTGIGGVKSEELGVGNGQSFYDLNGHKVSHPEKGKIYIVNGRKVKIQ